MAKDKRLHVAMFPWLAFGHMIPYLELSKFIAQNGHKVSFISTPRNIDRLPKLPPQFSTSISFVKISLPKTDQLPEDAESTTDLRSNEEMDYLKKAFDGLELEVTKFLEESVPDWVIYDFTPYWLPPVASRLGISRGFFFIINAWTLAYYGPLDGSEDRSKPEDFMVKPKWVNFDTPIVYKRFEANWMLGSTRNAESGASDAYRGSKVIGGCDAIFLRHCYEFEHNWLKLLEELHGKPAIPLGLMPPEVPDNDDDEQIDDTWISIKSWFDGQNNGSVVYVALGSEVVPNQDQLTELALGLELSGVPFFWVLRSASSESESINLPVGFEDRIRGRGMVWRSWAPQLKILNHGSVGGFLTHCGWSSILEGLMFSHPLIALPFLADQGLNSRIVVGMQLGIEIPRNEHDGSYTRDSVANSVRLVVVEKEGKTFNEKAKEMSDLINNRELQDSYLNNFVEFLENHRSKVGREV